MTSIEKVSNFAFLYLVAYALWRFIFQHTILSSSLLIYGSFVLLLVLFSLVFFCSNIKNGAMPDIFAILWGPFLIYMSTRLLLEGRVEQSVYWVIFSIVICLPKTFLICDKVPYKFMLCSGFFIVASVYFQFFFPNVFDRFYSSFFIDSHKDLWVQWEYGFVGFTYQLGMTAEIIVIAECVLFFYWMKKKDLNKIVFVICAILFIIAVLLTGKRTSSAISILIPVVAMLLKKKADLRQIVYIIIAAIIVVLAFSFFLMNLNLFIDNQIIRRLTISLLDYQAGISIDSGRDYLRNIALNLYSENPLCGIGPGKFAVLSGTGTDVHNVYVQTLCELGAVGIILFSIPAFCCFVYTFFLLKNMKEKYCQPYLAFSLLIQFSFFVGGMTQNSLVNLSGFLIYSIAIGLMINCRVLLNEQR